VKKVFLGFSGLRASSELRCTGGEHLFGGGKVSFFHILQSEALGLFNLFFPSSCLLCGTVHKKSTPKSFCTRCLDKIPPLLPPFCPRCALPYPAEEGSIHLCGECIREEPAFVSVYAAGIYEDVLRRAVHRFKFQGRSELDRPLARLLADKLLQAEDFSPELIVPVPLHPSRLRERTYNQALLLARCLGQMLEIPVVPRLLMRTRPTPSQQGLRAGERRLNQKGAFSLRGSMTGRRILLVDDVLTTGATIRECARVLQHGGALEIRVSVLARARRGASFSESD